jgi:hypothetical protein
MMFYLQKFLLVILIKSLIISCVSLNLRSSKSENFVYEDVSLKNTNKESDNYSLTENKSQLQAPVINII